MTDYAASTPYRQVTVDMINLDNGRGNKVALITDLRTNNQSTVPMSSPGRLNPQEGDIWQLTRDGGYWAFDRLVAKGPERPISTPCYARPRRKGSGPAHFEP